MGKHEKKREEEATEEERYDEHFKPPIEKKA